MNILIAPDKFKGTLTADQVCSIITRGLKSVLPHACIQSCPIADGGDGFVDVLRQYLDGVWVSCLSQDALGRPLTARYALCGETAIMEMSEASGIRLIPEERRDIWQANTYGTGEMIRHAVEHSHANKIIMGIGGSVTNDAGCGMAASLGVQFLDQKKQPLESTPYGLRECVAVDVSQRMQLPQMLVACDVENPLLGDDGATRIYGPQKGAKDEDIAGLESFLNEIVQLTDGHEEAVISGAGAAGGLGFGLMKFAGAQLMPGFDLVAKETGLRQKIEDSDVVITGEGKLDAQTLHGKGPAGVATMAREARKKVVAIAGVVEPASEHLFDHALSLHDVSRSLEETMVRSEELLGECAVEMGHILAAG